MEKIQETPQHIHEIAQAEGIESDNLPAREAMPQQLESSSNQLEVQVDTLTEEIEATEEVPTRKALRARRSALKKQSNTFTLISFHAFINTKHITIHRVNAIAFQKLTLMRHLCV